MKTFELHDATSVQQAVSLLTQFGATGKVLAGGSDIVGGIMKDWVQGKGMPLPSALVDITTIPELTSIKVSGGGATIGAAATLTSIVESAELQKSYPLLVASAESVASP